MKRQKYLFRPTRSKSSGEKMALRCPQFWEPQHRVIGDERDREIRDKWTLLLKKVFPWVVSSHSSDTNPPPVGAGPAPTKKEISTSQKLIEWMCVKIGAFVSTLGMHCPVLYPHGSGSREPSLFCLCSWVNLSANTWTTISYLTQEKNNIEIVFNHVCSLFSLGTTQRLSGTTNNSHHIFQAERKGSFSQLCGSNSAEGIWQCSWMNCADM